MKAVYRKSPSRAKYDKIWDGEPVLNKLASWSNAKNLDVAQLMNKVYILMALGIAQRMQILFPIELSNIKKLWSD